MKVLAAMSGGVDSAVAAARAAEAGHEVVGVHMALSKNRDQTRSGSRGCCTVEDASDARRAADRIGIPYYVWDLSDDFHDLVVEDFLSEYAAGRTPNPCVRCNERIKFATLMDRARLLGFDAVCTGHYASIRTDGPDGAPSLHRSRNMAKDQSYVLAVMGPGAVGRSLFPLGEYETKEEVRAEARARGLGVSTKPDSYDICFVADGDTQGFLERNLGASPGEILDADGSVIGSHQGTHGFTIGQRKGLGIQHPAADGAPRYVVDIDPSSRQVVVGAAELLSTRELIATDVISFEPLSVGREVRAQIRAHGEATPARLLEVPTDATVPATTADGAATGATADSAATGAAATGAAASGAAATGAGADPDAPTADSSLRVSLETPIRGVAPGQTLVLYDGDRVIAAATLERRA